MSSNVRPRTSLLARVITIFLVLNAILLSAYSYSGQSIFSDINNALAGAVLIACVASALVARQAFSRHRIFLLFLMASVLLTIITNIGRTNIVDVMKYISVFAFYGVGKYVLGEHFLTRRTIIALIAVIFFGIFFAHSVVYWDDDGAFSFFPNTNTATIYIAALIFCYPQLPTFAIYGLQLLQVVLLQKNGSILSTLIAFAVWNFRINIRSIFTAILGLIALIVAFFSGLLDRFTSDTFQLFSDISSYGLYGVIHMSYLDIITIHHSTDLSGYFRLKHWFDIIANYLSGGPLVYLFGYGPGRTQYITVAQLIPHNDYLRVLAEFGLTNFICFVALNVAALRGIKDTTHKMLFSVLLIYFFSENLIDNYGSMVMFYVGAGVLSRPNGASAPKGVQTPQYAPTSPRRTLAAAAE